jgi:flagellar basal-body rod protein FlgC
MDHRSTFAISAAGMALERARVETAALNIANANTTQGAGQPAYAPLRVVAHAAAGRSFATLMQGATGAPALADLAPDFSVEAAAVSPRLVHDPAHPMANERGFVAYPGVDVAAEMVTLMSATRAYEANVAAMNAGRSMAAKALDIGGST